jgi:hypothetical protein
MERGRSMVGCSVARDDGLDATALFIDTTSLAPTSAFDELNGLDR